MRVRLPRRGAPGKGRSLLRRPDESHVRLRWRIRAVEMIAAHDDCARIERHFEAFRAAADRPFGDETALDFDCVDRAVALVGRYFPEFVVGGFRYRASASRHRER